MNPSTEHSSAAPARMKTKLVAGAFDVAWHEIERCIKAEYGHEFSVEADQEAGNDQTLDFNVDTRWFGEYERKAVDAFRETGRYGFLLQALLGDLCIRQLIPAGRYLIRISY